MARIFISHSSADSDAAVAMRDWLFENGWDDVFLDLDPERGIRAGDRWQDTLRAAAHRCEAIIFLISRHWLGSKWCLAEYLYAKKLGKRVMPVLLEPAPLDELPVEMVAEHQVVDLQGDADARRRLKLGLEAAGVAARSFPFPEGRRPYPGLQPLEQEDAAAFFGRDAEILGALDELRRLRETGARSLLVLLGASGAGKSSLLRSGLAPRLQRDDRAYVALAPVRPGGAALTGPDGLWASLERAATSERLAALLPADLPRAQGAIAAALRDDPGALIGFFDALRDAAARASLAQTPPSVVLSIDQGEELFAGDGRAEADAFFEMLGETLRNDRRALAVIAIRSDAYPLLQAETRLPASLHQPFNLAPMDRSGLRDVIEGPARLVGLEIEPALTAALLEDATGADALPLLAFTLERLHRSYGAAGRLRLEDYRALGGVSGAIQAAVDAALADPPRSLPSDREALDALMRRAFIPHLVRVLPEGGFARRIARRDDIPAASQAVADLLVDGRLLVRDRRADGDDTIEIAHEALLREWPLLAGWLEEEREFLVWRERIAGDRLGFETNQRGLLRDRELAIAEAWIETRADEIPPADRDYVTRSVVAEARRRDAARRRSRIVAIAASAAAVVGFGLAGAATHQYFQANEARQTALTAESAALAERDRAEAAEATAVAERDRAAEAEVAAAAERDQALLTQSRFLADLSRQRLNDGRVEEATALAVEALPIGDADARPFAPEAERALEAALRQYRLIASTVATGAVLDLATSPNGERILIVREDGTVSLIDVSAARGGALAETRVSLDVEATAIAWSAATDAVAIGASDASVRLLDGDSLTERARLETTRGPSRLAFSDDGARLAAATGTRPAVFDLADPSAPPVAEIPLNVVSATDLKFSADGQLLATTSSDGFLSVWRIGAPAESADDAIVRLKTYGGWATSLERLDVDGQAGVDGFVFGSGRGALLTLPQPPEIAQGVSSSVDGKPAAEEPGPPRAVRLHAHAVQDMAISPGEDRIATLDAAGRLRIERVYWRLEDGSPEASALDDALSRARADLGEDAPVAGALLQGFSIVAHSSDGARVAWLDDQRVVTGGADGTVKIWSLTPAQQAAAFGPGDGADRCIGRAGFISDGSRVAAGCGDGSVRIWEVGGAAAPVVIPGPEGQQAISLLVANNGLRAVSKAYGPGAALWDLQNDTLIGSLDVGGSIVKQMAISADGRRVATVDGDGLVRLFDGAGEETGQWRLPPADDAPRDATALSFAPDGAMLFVGARDGFAALAPSAALDAATPLSYEASAVWSGVFSPDGARFALVTGGGAFALWDVDNLATPVSTTLRDGSLRALTVSPDGAWWYAGAHDGSVLVFDGVTGALIDTWTTENRPVWSVAASPSGDRLAVASGDAAQIWDVAAGGAVASIGHDASTGWISFSPDGTRILTAAPDAHVWSVAPNRQSLGDVASRLGARCLSTSERIAAFLDPQPGDASPCLRIHP